MAGSSQQFAYGMGATQVNIGVGGAANVLIKPPIYTNGVFFKYLSGGSLSIVSNGISGSPGASGALGYILSTTEVVNIDGPAMFFLAASGTTAVAEVVFRYSGGMSLMLMPG